MATARAIQNYFRPRITLVSPCLCFWFPVRLTPQLKLGFKQPKWIVAMEVTSCYTGGYWEDGGYNWFSGL